MIKDEDRQTAGANKSVLEQINSLKREDERLYNILAIDVWALAKTMDEYQPGFWSAFMKNREKALKRFLTEVMKNKPVDTKRPPFLRWSFDVQSNHNTDSKTLSRSLADNLKTVKNWLRIGTSVN